MDTTLERLRRALVGAARRPAPDPAPPSGADIGKDLLGKFEAELLRASGRLVRVDDVEAAETWVKESYEGERIAWAWASAEPDEATLRAAEVGVDRADGLIAETGTVVRTFPSAEVARTSLVPPVSVFIALEEDLVRDLPEALGLLAARHREGRAASILITGPSRTADIEKQLVIPAHGPRELVVILAARA